MKRAVAASALAVTMSVTSIIPTPVPAYALSPTFGWLDYINIYTDGTLRVTGWAATADYPTTPLGVRVRIDGQLAIPSFRIANEYRPDVGAAYPGYGNYHGFQFTVPAPEGTHTVTVEAQNSGVYNTISGSKSYTLSAGGARLFRGSSYEVVPGSQLNWSFYHHGTDLSSQIHTAMYAWNGTSTNLNLTETYNLDYQVGFYPATTWNGSFAGRTYTYPCSSPSALQLGPGCTYDWSDVLLDMSNMTTDDFRIKVAAHEFGHAMGLSHPPTNYPSVMINGSPGSGNVTRDPSPQDAARFNRLYPQSYFDSP